MTNAAHSVTYTDFWNAVMDRSRAGMITTRQLVDATYEIAYFAGATKMNEWTAKMLEPIYPNMVGKPECTWRIK
jgi:hypothetical protein